MLSVSLRHGFPGFTLDAAFEAPGGVTALFGRSGSGKTTIVNAVAGLLRPDRGRIVIGGRVLMDSATGAFLPPHKRRIGYVFQEARLFPHLTVRQNLTYGARFAPRGAQGPTLDHVVDLLGIGRLLDRRPALLSGGEKARVAIGRALLSRPELLILDEPLAALDDRRRAAILPYLERLQGETAIPILYISHVIAEVARLANTLVLIDAGRVTRTGPLEDLLSDPATAALLDSDEVGAVLPGRVAGHEGDGLTRIASPAGDLLVPGLAAPVGYPVRVRIRAAEVIVSLVPPQDSSALNVLPATVSRIEGDGPMVLVQLRLPGGAALLARITRRSVAALGLAPGTACHATIKSAGLVQGGTEGQGESP
ncbi:molybdenum ABC transporter ATP-binding protein [Paracoccus sp. Z118]|nr:molybdenum ABC transporter ATP-binding protein [Paracoccus sp. Z118]